MIDLTIRVQEVKQIPSQPGMADCAHVTLASGQVITVRDDSIIALENAEEN